MRKARRGPIAHRGCENEMTEPLYISRVSVETAGPMHRRAVLPTGATVDMGVHGPVAAHYGIDAAPRPLPVDYIVASTAG